MLRILNVFSQALEAINRAEDVAKEISSWTDEYALRWAMYASLQNVLDAVSMMVARKGLRKPRSYSELSDVLYEANIITSDEAELLRRVAHERNVLAHAYRRISGETLKKLVHSLLKVDVREFIHRMIERSEELEIDPELNTHELKELKEVFEKFGVKVVYLFGSRARGMGREDSDWDFAVYANDKLSSEERFHLTLRISEKLKVPLEWVDVVDLRDVDPLLGFTVIEEGVIVHCVDAELAHTLEYKILREYLDAQDLYHLYLKELKTTTKRRQ